MGCRERPVRAKRRSCPMGRASLCACGLARPGVGGGGGAARARHGPAASVEGDDLDVRRAHVGPDQDRFSAHRMVCLQSRVGPAHLFGTAAEGWPAGMPTVVIILSNRVGSRRGGRYVRCSMLCRVGNVRNSWGGYGTALRGAVYLASLGLELSYAELLGRFVAASTRSDTDVRSRNYRGLGPLFMLRLTVCGYGAAHVLPGGGAAAASVTYGALRARRVDRKAVGCA